MIKHNISTIQIFQTTDYKLFTTMQGNRVINTRKVSKIIQEIESGNDWLEYCPILVSVDKNNLLILDGQHRFFIAKKLKRPVHYILVKEDRKIVDVARVNSNTERWKASDFLNCYISQRNKNYVILKDFVEKYKFGINMSCKLLANGKPGAEGTNYQLNQLFEKGEFEVKEQAKAKEIAEMVHRFSGFTHFQDRAFLVALYKIREAGKVSIDQVSESFEKYPELLTHQKNYKGYIMAIEALVNHKKQKRIIIT